MTTEKKQLRREDLSAMSPAEIVKADEEGRLVALLAGRDPIEVDAEREALAAKPQLDRADLSRMSPAEIVEAEEAGRLDVLLGKRPAEETNDPEEN